MTLTQAQTAAALHALQATIARCGDRDDRRGVNGDEDGSDERVVSDWDADHRALADEDRTDRQLRWFE